MKINIRDFQTFNKSWNKKEINDKTEKILKKIGELQYKMYAQNKYSLLIVFQGLDASGKDGLIKELLKHCNPIGLKVYSFKKPTETEYAHDFLWRVHNVTPAKGEIQVYIRSHYEDILVPTVEKFIPENIIEERYQLINDFERIIEHNDTKILKFFLNVSKKTQEERLMERIETEKKHWKHKDSDWDTREKFDEYLDVYEKVVNKCNEIPWHIVPADTNWQKLYFVADIVLKTMKSLDLKWPELESETFNK
jgi:PPK2 family polyphosphate:nucleotide phosphotransferase